MVDYSVRFPAFNIPANKQKSDRREILPVAPEFAELLETIPPGNRNGFVFNPLPAVEGAPRLGVNAVKKRLIRIG